MLGDCSNTLKLEVSTCMCAALLLHLTLDDANGKTEDLSGVHQLRFYCDDFLVLLLSDSCRILPVNLIGTDRRREIFDLGGQVRNISSSASFFAAVLISKAVTFDASSHHSRSFLNALASATSSLTLFVSSAIMRSIASPRSPCSATSWPEGRTHRDTSARPRRGRH